MHLLIELPNPTLFTDNALVALRDYWAKVFAYFAAVP